jgi:hypothetical protein
MVVIFPCCSFHLIYLGSRLVYINSGHGESAQLVG